MFGISPLNNFTSNQAVKQNQYKPKGNSVPFTSSNQKRKEEKNLPKIIGLITLGLAALGFFLIKKRNLNLPKNTSNHNYLKNELSQNNINIIDSVPKKLSQTKPPEIILTKPSHRKLLPSTKGKDINVKKIELSQRPENKFTESVKVDAFLERIDSVEQKTASAVENKGLAEGIVHYLAERTKFDKSPLIRGLSVIGLGKIVEAYPEYSGTVFDAIILLKNDKSIKVRQSVASEIGKIGREQKHFADFALDELTPMTRDKDEIVKTTVLDAIISIRSRCGSSS